MNSAVERIIQQYLSKVRPSGNQNILATCPFHRKPGGGEEENPSFTMHVESGLWLCFSCHASGNLYTFLRDMGVPRAHIDTQYGGAIEEARKYAPQASVPHELKEEEIVEGGILPEALLGLFDYCPQLLVDEGYPEALLQAFDIGYDAQHERITFPLRDVQGRLVGISGRAIRPEMKPRYRVYDYEYQDFGLAIRKTNKSTLLWNMHNVYAHIAHRKFSDRYLVLTEGFKATMRVVHAGVSNTVGAIGSDLSDEQRWLISRLGGPVYLMFDNNEAGILGCIKAGRKLVQEVHTLLVPVYDGYQPSDLSLEAVADSIATAIPWTSWLQQHITATL